MWYLKKTCCLAAGILLGVTACHRAPSPEENDNVESIGEVSIDSITYDTTKATLAGKMARDSTVPEMKEVQIKVDTGGVFVNRQRLDSMSLSDTLAAIWRIQWKQYEQIPPVSLRFSDEILMGVRGDIRDQLGAARREMQDTLAENTFQLPYKGLKYKQQAALKKKYPALFRNGELKAEN